MKASLSIGQEFPVAKVNFRGFELFDTLNGSSFIMDSIVENFNLIAGQHVGKGFVVLILIVSQMAFSLAIASASVIAGGAVSVRAVSIGNNSLFVGRGRAGGNERQS